MTDPPDSSDSSHLIDKHSSSAELFHMNKSIPYLLVAVAAIGLVMAQRLWVYGMDDFTLTAHNNKVFTYGLPFRITDSPFSPMHTTLSQAALRMAANFTIFFLAGSACILFMRRSRLHISRRA